MPQFKDILGQTHIKNHLQRALSEGKVSHACLFTGEALSGKKMLATVLAQAMVCENPREEGKEPCGQCSACRRVENRAHPDVRLVTHEKENSIRVPEIATQVVDDVMLTPYEAEKKIYIIPDADLMTTEAQNKLLKTLEEPPAYACFLLLSERPGALLPTVRSRLVPMAIRPVRDEELMAYLQDQGHTRYRSLLAVRFARGNAGRAISLSSDEDFLRRTTLALEMVEQLENSPLNRISDTLSSVMSGHEDERQVREELFLLIRMLIRDIGVYKTTGNEAHLIFADRLEYIRDVAQSVTTRDLLAAYRAVGEASMRIEANVNTGFAMESMMMRERDTLRRVSKETERSYG